MDTSIFEYVGLNKYDKAFLVVLKEFTFMDFCNIYIVY